MLAELGAFTLLHEYERSDFISCLPAVVGARSSLTESVQRTVFSDSPRSFTALLVSFRTGKDVKTAPSHLFFLRRAFLFQRRCATGRAASASLHPLPLNLPRS